MNVLSLFNGMSFGMMALEDNSVKVDKYYSSEIDKYANQATQALFPDTIQLGDVTQWRDWDIDWASIDLITGGFPCQAWSMAGKQLGDKDERGMLFWVMIDIIKHVKYHNPKADFLIENVKMKKEFEKYITTHTENALGNVHKILINSALVSAQNRNRYYWTNFAVEQPEDEGILLKDIIEGEHETRPCELIARKGPYTGLCHEVASDISGNFRSVKAVYAETGKSPTLTTMGGGHREPKVLVASTGRNSEGARTLRQPSEKSPTITARYYKGVQSDGAPFIYSGDKVKGDVFDYKEDAPKYRKLTPRECFRLQTVPEHHIETLLSAGISNTQLYKMCGNGFTMKVISHILNGIN